MPKKLKLKQVLFKTYSALNSLNKTLNLIREKEISNLELCILGKTDSNFLEIKDSTKALVDLENNWKTYEGNLSKFKFLHNPKIGKIFIVGFLESMFLNDLEGKKLGSMSVGPYGILRGLGASQLEANEIIKALTEGSYLLIVRGYHNELDALEAALSVH